MSGTAWDPEQYARFRAERSRPFHDLVARTPVEGVRFAADLGCGSGELTRTLIDRWARATVTGVDTSPEMLARARSGENSPRLSFVRGDARDWRPETPLDVLVSNAMLQWVPDHGQVIPALVDLLAPGGTLAFQVPNNRVEPAYVMLWQLREEEPWRSLAPDARRFYVEEPVWYIETLRRLGCAVELWETVYYHQLPGPEAIVEWMKGTALRPVLSRLDEEQADTFLRELLSRIEDRYVPGPAGTIFPFQRLFAVATRQ